MTDAASGPVNANLGVGPFDFVMKAAGYAMGAANSVMQFIDVTVQPGGGFAERRGSPN